MAGKDRQVTLTFTIRSLINNYIERSAPPCLNRIKKPATALPKGKGPADNPDILDISSGILLIYAVFLNILAILPKFFNILQEYCMSPLGARPDEAEIITA